MVHPSALLIAAPVCLGDGIEVAVDVGGVIVDGVKTRSILFLRVLFELAKFSTSNAIYVIDNCSRIC